MGLDGAIILAFILGIPANEIVIPILTMLYMSNGTFGAELSIEAISELFSMNGWNFTTALCMAIFALFHWPCSTSLITVYKETKSAKRAAYEALLKEVRISGKRLPSVLKIADLATIELDDKGKIKNRAAIEKTVKEEFSDFIETQGEEGADPANPPENDGGKGGENTAYPPSTRRMQDRFRSTHGYRRSMHIRWCLLHRCAHRGW